MQAAPSNIPSYATQPMVMEQQQQQGVPVMSMGQPIFSADGQAFASPGTEVLSMQMAQGLMYPPAATYNEGTSMPAAGQAADVTNLQQVSSMIAYPGAMLHP